MKTKLVTLASIVALTAASNGAISLGSTALKNVQGSTGTDLVAGRLGLLIVDTTGDGFLTGGGDAVTGNPVTGTTYGSLGANLSLNSLFYGDLVLARLTTAVAFGDTTMAGVFAGAITSTDPVFNYTSKNFAIVWFDTLTTAGTDTVASGAFGIARGADWTLPAADSGSFTFGTGVTNLDQLTLGATATAPSGQGVAFATNGASLSVIPEPSAALLGALGALGLLRRRRN
jgi:hypothetical protein